MVLQVLWLLRHHDNPPQQKVKGSSKSEDLVDRHLPELLFHMEELRALVKKYSQVLQRYYVQYLSGYDAIALTGLLKKLSDNFPNLIPDGSEESVLLNSFCTELSQLSVKQVEEGCPFDFAGLRLDWFRLQTFCSQGAVEGSTGLNLKAHPELAALLNQLVFHTKMVDNLDEALLETSDLSIFWFVL
ncbi:Nck-associated protein 1 [Trinorchestia longiramus]|nr:Nck-associated protein 1 [Trinorchestia longiramus]